MNKKLTKRKAFNFLRSYFDVLNEIPDKQDKLDYLLSIINKQFLDEDPKDLNFLANLCYESQRHAIESSVKGWERAQNDTLGTTPPTPLPTTSVTDPKEEEEKEEVQGKEQEEDKGEIKKPKTFPFRKSLIDLGVEEQVSDDWMKVRRTKKATNTETSFKQLVTQIEKSGKPANECITMSVENSWKGFKSEWINKTEQNGISKNEQRIIDLKNL
jgi:hypothetical protein